MKKLLIIEDNKMMMTFLANYFQEEYLIEMAENPTVALSLFETRKSTEYDMVISDYKATKHNEYTALKRVANQLRWQQIPLIILTDEDKSAERLNSLSIGAKDTLSKPFNPKELKFRMSSLEDAMRQLPIEKAA